MNSLGEAVLDLTADDSMLMKGIAGAKASALDALGGLSNIGGTIVKAGMVAAVAGTTLLVKGLYDSVQAAMDAEVVQAQLNAVLKSTDGIAGVTADQVNKLATSLSEMTMFDDEAIVSAESMLLTFTNIGKNVFPDATKTVLDMSQALGQDLQTSSIQLGKALNDPIAGVTALQRVGVKFTEEQKNMIEQLVKSGKLEEAQALILKELQTEFGGSAEAAGKTFAGQLKILQTKLGNVQELIGAKLLPILTQFFTKLSEWASRPEVQAMLEQMATKIAAFATKAIENIPKVIQMFQNMVAWLQNNQGVIVAVLAVLGTAIAAFAYTTLAPLLPIIAVMALIGAAAYLLYQAWTTNFGGIQDKVAAVWAFLQPVLQNLWNWLKINIPAAIQALTNAWNNVILPALTKFWSFLQVNLFPQLKAMANLISAVLSVAFTAMAGIIEKVIIPKLTALYEWFSTKILPVIKEVAGWLKDKLSPAFSWVSTSIGKVVEWIDKLAAKLRNIKLPDWMTPGSPTPWEIGLLGINSALKKVGTIGLPSLSANMNMMAAPAIAGNGGMALSGGGGAGMNIQFVYQPFIGVNDEYEAKNKMRDIVNAVMRENKK